MDEHKLLLLTLALGYRDNQLGGEKHLQKVTPDLCTSEHEWASEYELLRSCDVFSLSFVLLQPFSILCASFQAARESLTQVSSSTWSGWVCCSAFQLLALFLLFVPASHLKDWCFDTKCIFFIYIPIVLPAITTMYYKFHFWTWGGGVGLSRGTALQADCLQKCMLLSMQCKAIPKNSSDWKNSWCQCLMRSLVLI